MSKGPPGVWHVKEAASSTGSDVIDTDDEFGEDSDDPSVAGDNGGDDNVGDPPPYIGADSALQDIEPFGKGLPNTWLNVHKILCSVPREA